MSKKRPTESSWESDDEILLEDTSGISAFSKKNVDEEVIDEDALLGIGENTMLDGGAYELQLDDSGAALFDMTADSQEVLDYEDTYQEGLDEQAAYQEEPLVVESGPNTTTTAISHQQPNKSVFSQPVKSRGAGNESGDSDSEEEKKKRDRFKTERQTVSLKSTKHTAEIPDKLEVTKEMQAEIESFEKQKNQKGKKGNKRQRQQHFQNQRNPGQFNQGQFRQQRPTGPRGFNHQPRGPNQNFGARQHRPFGPRQNGPQQFQPQSIPQQTAPRPIIHQAPGPFPHEIVGQNNFAVPQPYSQHQPHSQPLLPDPGPLMSPHLSQAQFNPNPATLVQSSGATTIHVNPNFHGSPSPDQHHLPQHVLPQNHYPGSPQPLIQQPPQQQMFMQGHQPHMEPAPRPGLLESPRPNFIPQPRPLLEHPRHAAPLHHQQQQQFHPNNRGPNVRHHLPQGQFSGPSGAPVQHQQQPRPHHVQPRHPGQNMQQSQRPMHHQGQPRHQNPQHVRPQRFQNQQRGPAPQNQQGYNPNLNQQQMQRGPAPQVQPEQDPELLAKQRELEEKKRRRLERFSQNAEVVPSASDSTTVKISTGQKRRSTEGIPNVSPAKIAKIKTAPPRSLDDALEQQKKMREKIRQMKELQRQAQATERRKQLAQKLAKEGKTLADIESQKLQNEPIQTITTVYHQQPQQPQQQQEFHQQQEQVYQQQQQQQQQFHQPQQVNAARGRAGQNFGANRGQMTRGRGQQVRGHGQVMRGRGQNNMGRGQMRPASGQNYMEDQGQPISVLGQSPAQDKGGSARGRGQFKARGGGNQNLQQVPIQEFVDYQQEMDVSPQRTVIPAGQGAAQHRQQAQAKLGMNSMGAGSQGRGAGSQGRGAGSQGRGAGSQGRGAASRGRGAALQGRGAASQGRGAASQGRGAVSQGRGAQNQNKSSGRIVVASASNLANQSPQKRTVLSSSDAPRRVVMDSFGGSTSSVAIEGLSSNANLGTINGYCASIGQVTNFNYMANERKVMVRFANPNQAVQFIKKYNRHMVDLTMIKVKSVPDF